MSVPLSGAQDFPQQVPGMFGGPRGRITPRGAYTVAGVGDPQLGYSGYGYFWGPYANIMSGVSGFAGVSTETGATVGTPVEAEQGKVGGGAAAAEPSPMGGTAAY